MTKPEVPCHKGKKDCDERAAGCHSRCPYWKEYDEKRKAYENEINHGKALYYVTKDLNR